MTDSGIMIADVRLYFLLSFYYYNFLKTFLISKIHTWLLHYTVISGRNDSISLAVISGVISTERQWSSTSNMSNILFSEFLRSKA